MPEDYGALQRRDGLMIIGELLENMQEPAKLTHVLYKTNLSYIQVKRYLEMLTKMELIQKIHEPYLGFQITEKGRILVQILASHPRKGRQQDLKVPAMP